MRKLVKNIFFIFLILMCFMNTQCEDENDDLLPSDCDFTTVIDKSEYDNLESANFTFGNVEIIGDCLTINVGASGCDGNTWQYMLVDSGAIAESSPEQRYLKFQLINNELCLAVFSKTVSFDLSPLQINNTTNEVLLNIEGLETPLRYKY